MTSNVESITAICINFDRDTKFWFFSKLEVRHLVFVKLNFKLGLSNLENILLKRGHRFEHIIEASFPYSNFSYTSCCELYDQTIEKPCFMHSLCVLNIKIKLAYSLLINVWFLFALSWLWDTFVIWKMYRLTQTLHLAVSLNWIVFELTRKWSLAKTKVLV